MTISEECKARFWSRVRKGDGCWLWTGGLNKPNGYGQINVQRRHRLAHQVAWCIANPGSSIPPGQCVLHRCDNPQCVNPDHLFLGTHSDNMHDMYSKDRRQSARGEKHGLAKLTSQDVIAIRARKARGLSLHRLAKDFGVARRTIQHVVQRRTWTHV